MNPERLTWDQLPTLPSSVDTLVPEFGLDPMGIDPVESRRRDRKTSLDASPEPFLDHLSNRLRICSGTPEVTGNPSTSGPVQEHPGSRP